jgi:hypothetical protein
VRKRLNFVSGSWRYVGEVIHFYFLFFVWLFNSAFSIETVYRRMMELVANDEFVRIWNKVFVA